MDIENFVWKMAAILFCLGFNVLFIIITWTKADHAHRRLYAALGEDELKWLNIVQFNGLMQRDIP